MGAGASAEVPDDVKQVMKNEIGITSAKVWLEGGDVKDLKQCKAEIKRLRALAFNALKEGDKKPGAKKAIFDKGGPAGEFVLKPVKRNDAATALIKTAMAGSPLFKNVKPEEQSDMLAMFSEVKASAGEKIITQGDQGHNFYILESGTVNISLIRPGSEEATDVGSLDAGSSFGELALMYGTPRAATCVATSACTLWTIDRGLYRQILQHHAIIRSKKYAEFLAQVKMEDDGMSKTLGECLSYEALENLGKALEENVYEKGEVIIRQGEVGDFFYLIESGEVAVHIDDSLKKGKIAGAPQEKDKKGTITAGKCFGEKALIKDDTRAASIVATTKTKCLELGREDFQLMLGSITDLLKGTGEPEPEVAPTESRKDEMMKLEDFDNGVTLGHGAFGRVKLVKHLGTGKTYALKCQAKKAIVENSLQEHILMERQILMKLDHPFILKLYSALQDSKYVYFVLEILLGGELFTWLRNMGRFEEQQGKFYSAQVVKGFEHMHSKKIAYRDLKPENLVLDEKGYLKIVDLGLAKIVEGKTWTLCGTPDYLAPEIILNEGHDKAVDYWALGVLIFELVAGMPPFYADDPMEVYEKILSVKMTIPQHFSKNLSDIVRKLLKLCQSKRIGNGKGGCGAIAKHKWFSGFDWDGLLTFALDSPITVKVKGQDDTSNFDDYGDEADTAEDTDWNPVLDDVP